MAKVFKWLILAAKIYLPYELKLFFYMYLLTLDNFFTNILSEIFEIAKNA